MTRRDETVASFLSLSLSLCCACGCLSLSLPLLRFVRVVISNEELFLLKFPRIFPFFPSVLSTQQHHVDDGSSSSSSKNKGPAAALAKAADKERKCLERPRGVLVKAIRINGHLATFMRAWAGLGGSEALPVVLGGELAAESPGRAIKCAGVDGKQHFAGTGRGAATTGRSATGSDSAGTSG